MPEDWREDEGVVLSRDVLHHLLDVLRVQTGDRILLFDGQGREATAEIVAVDQRELRLRMLSDEKRASDTKSIPSCPIA